jgi:two-component system, sensor histidine kinase
MAAVFGACVVFAIARFALTASTGQRTPWWANALGALAIVAIHLWYRRQPTRRSTVAVHGTAAVAAVALVIPIAYGMSSTIWWLSLVGYAVVLLGRSAEARLWGIGIPILIAVATLAEPHVHITGAAGETRVEIAMARVAFAILVVGMAAAFRVRANRRAAELARTTADLQRASAARSRFLAHLSHDIRTPLHGVISMSDLALRGELSAASREQITTVHQSARVLLDLLNNLLDVTRAESGGLQLEVLPFALRPALREVLLPFASQARGQGLSFEASADPELVDDRLGDRFRFSQIALNLVGNALKFTTAGGIRVRLRREPGIADGLRLEVEDTGPGIAPGNAAGVFEPFSHATSPAAGQRPGSGLGLAITREIARRMHGDVTLDSEVGKGSRFTARLRIPIDPRASPTNGPADLLAETGTVGKPVAMTVKRQLRVLVCEDDPINQKVVSLMLDRLGHRCTIVGSAEEAWSTIATGPDFDLLLTDIELPGMDGVELMRKVRALPPGTRGAEITIIAATAHVGADERRRLLQAGFDGHLPKPFDLEGLREVSEQVELDETLPSS